MGFERYELLGDGADDRQDDRHDEEYGEEPGEESAVRSVLRAVGAPEALALASLVLATVSLLGIGVLNGAPYLPTPYSTEGPPEQSVFVLTALLGAGLALLPAVLGTVALRRLPDDSPSRVVAGAAVLLAAVSVLLRLAVAARTATDESVQFIPF